VLEQVPAADRLVAERLAAVNTALADHRDAALSLQSLHVLRWLMRQAGVAGIYRRRCHGCTRCSRKRVERPRATRCS
jgi:hypothetical protein